MPWRSAIDISSDANLSPDPARFEGAESCASASSFPTQRGGLEAGRESAEAHLQLDEPMPRSTRMMQVGGADRVADVSVIGAEDEAAERMTGFAAAGMPDFLAAPLAYGDATWEHTTERMAAMAL